VTGRVNLIANTLTDVSTAVVEQGGKVTIGVLEKGGSAIVGGFEFLDNVATVGVIASEGWVEEARASKEGKADRRAFNRVKDAEALKLEIAAYSAAKAS